MAACRVASQSARQPWRRGAAQSLAPAWLFLKHCFADKAYAGERVGSATAIKVEVVGAPAGQKGFAVQPKRWVVERTFSWINRWRRLNRDHEATPPSATAFFTIAAAMVLVQRLARQ